MGKASLILDKYLVVIPEKFAISVRVFAIADNPKYPEGVKTSFVLLDLELGQPIFLIDNHAPFGFHQHIGMPGNKELREELKVSTYQEAYLVFMAEVDTRVKEYKNKN
jgi:hypothetical protein